MKKFLLGALAAAAVAAPGVAAADTNAVVGLHYGNSDYGPGDFDSYGLNGAFSHDFSGGTFLQMDADLGRIDAGSDVASSYGALHYGVRNDSYAFGGFVGLEDFFGLSGTSVGLEGQWYASNLVLNGSVGYLDLDDANLDFTNVQIDGGYFFTPNLQLTGLIAHTEADYSSGDTDWTTYGIGGEYRFSGSPFSVALNYRTADTDGDDVDSWMIGFNFDLGTGSLQERATHGPSLNGASALHANSTGLLP